MGYWIWSIPAFPLLIILPTLISSLCFQIAYGGGDSDLKYICSSPKTESITFAKNLNNLWTDLNNITSFYPGFWNQSFGEGPNDRVYALGLCRVDVPSNYCRYCLSMTETTHCPNATGAILWREHCHVKYSNFNFFGEIDTVNNFTMVSKENVNPKVFRTAVIGLLGNLTQNATKDTTGYMFAKGKINEPEEAVDIFGMAQCTQDLSLKNCRTCLEGALNELNKINWFADGSPKSWRFETGSCKLRYEEL